MFLHLYLPNPAIVIQKSSFPFYPCFGTFIKFYVKLSAQYISRAYYAHMTEKEWTGKKGWSWENRLLKFEISQSIREHFLSYLWQFLWKIEKLILLKFVWPCLNSPPPPCVAHCQYRYFYYFCYSQLILRCLEYGTAWCL